MLAAPEMAGQGELVPRGESDSRQQRGPGQELGGQPARRPVSVCPFLRYGDVPGSCSYLVAVAPLSQKAV